MEFKLRTDDMQAKIEQLIELKKIWMASHITEAEFPTPLSKKGLALYQSSQQKQSTELISSTPDTALNSLTIYPVDCHPLTIRYSLILSSKWQNEQEKEAVIEYLTQIMFEAGSPAQLFVGFYKGKPVTCGMIFQPDNDVALISDVHALPLANQKELINEMESFLINRVHSDNVQLAITRG
ncbi:hypothetical protein MD588_13995 [Photobacterium sp. SDRW27]|uniref:hypothetical protein n=1 Tax=Photobacterium obscurum TaxID=2829490 RepID=UPI00224397B8|nr:hypothetical protein [Photobacterium obscurum]MCW8329916.1 hypothetical protein [Photobacterium obscurum]